MWRKGPRNEKCDLDHLIPALHGLDPLGPSHHPIIAEKKISWGGPMWGGRVG